MPLYAADALILRTYTLGESDRIVVFLTRDRGKKRGVARNARQSRRRFGGALEPMTYGRVGYVERERRELGRLRYLGQAASPPLAGGREGGGRSLPFVAPVSQAKGGRRKPTQRSRCSASVCRWWTRSRSACRSSRWRA